MITLGDNGIKGPMSSLLSGGMAVGWLEWHWNLFMVAGNTPGNDIHSALPSMFKYDAPL